MSMASIESQPLEIVVARYKEALAWTQTLRRRLPCRLTIYDKGGDGLGEPLPNIGREAHTYLTHIVARYHALPETIVFLQGDPFHHLETGADAEALAVKLQTLLQRRAPFAGLAWFKLKCDGLGRPHDLRDPAKEGRWAGWGKDIPVAETFRTLFAVEPPRQFLVSAPAGLFLARRERILARPPEFYRLALALVEADPHDAKNTGHAFERLWSVIFNGATLLNKDPETLRRATAALRNQA